MSNPLRNEFPIKLGDEDLVMRPDFEFICAIENDLRTRIVPLIEQISRHDVGVRQAAVIVYYGLVGYGDKHLTLKQVGEKIIEQGIGSVMTPIVEFLGGAMNGVSLGKSERVAESG